MYFSTLLLSNALNVREDNLGDDYQKPGSLFYMLADLIGDEAMKTALNAFLTNNEYGSATHKELLDAFNNVGGDFFAS